MNATTESIEMSTNFILMAFFRIKMIIKLCGINPDMNIKMEFFTKTVLEINVLGSKDT